MKFNELSKHAKEKVREWYCYEYCEDIIKYDLRERFQEMLKSNGFLNMKVYWSLGYCQGDGVAFGGNLDVGEYLAINYSNVEMRNVDMANPEFDPYQLPLVDKIKLVQKYPEFEPILDGEKYRKAYENDNKIWGKITHSGRYYHEKSMEVSCECYGDDEEIDDLNDEIEKEIESHIINLSIEMRYEGYNIINSYYDIDDEYLDNIMDGYEFDESGKMLQCA